MLAMTLSEWGLRRKTSLVANGVHNGHELRAVRKQCFDLQNGPTRYLTSGSAVARTVADDLGRGGGNPVPEPASWALMIAGFGMSGALLRARRGLRAART